MSPPQVPRPMGQDQLLGQELEGRYRVLEKLGEGGMSSVYLAQVLDTGERVAIKVLHDHLVREVDQRERFEREARALFGLEHPNILHVHDFGIFNGLPFLVMELLDGTTLDHLIEETPPEPREALEIARQVLSGLAFAHGQGVLHRDLKTENVFVARAADGTLSARLLDFGLVKFVDDERWGSGKVLTTYGEVFGTPAYMSPEQATGSPVGAPSDVYSMGVVLFELLTGAWPFMEDNRADMLRALLTRPPPDLAAAREDLEVRPELEAVVKKALAKEPAQRFADAGAMLHALESVPRPAAHVRGAGPPLAAMPVVSHEATWVPPQGRATAPTRKVPWLALALAGGALVFLVLVALAAALFILG